MENLHIFICHYNPLTERKTFILNELNNKIGNLLIKELECEFDNNVKEYKYEGFDENKTINYVYFIRKYDRQYLTKEIKDSMFLSCHDNKNNIRLEYSSVNNYQSNIVTYENFESKYKHSLCERGRKPAEESLALKHYEAIRLIANMDISYGLIIEDDCKITDKFKEKLDSKMKEFPENWDIYFPNSCPNPGFRTKGGMTQINNTRKIYIKNHPSSVFGVSYLVSKTSAKRLCDEIETNKLWLAIDHEFNWLFYKLKFNVIWNWESPKLTFWGESGFKSSLL
jgi:GR25 family glycosyltransferase involved in LPS biosynthesis